MALRITQRQLDALVEDARQEGRFAESHERTQRLCDRIFGRKTIHPPQAPVFTVWGDVKPGTVILYTDNGTNFHPYATVLNMDMEREGLKPGQAWVTYDLAEGGSGGSRVELSDRVLILAGTGGMR